MATKKTSAPVHPPVDLPVHYPQLLVIGVQLLVQDLNEASADAHGDRMKAYDNFVDQATALCKKYGIDDPTGVVDFVAAQESREREKQEALAMKIMAESGVDFAALAKQAADAKN